MWQHVRSWFAKEAEHVTVEFIPLDGASPIYPERGYLRLWLNEGFLARARTWGNDHFPALHGGVSLTFGGIEGTTFTKFAKSAPLAKAPGAQLNVPITALLPFRGGNVEVQAAMYQASTSGPLATAVQLVGGFASLLGPPLATAATIASKMSAGLDAVLDASNDQPVLGVHWSMVSPGGGLPVLRSGHLVVVNTPREKLGGALCIVDGLLHVNDGSGPRRLTGADYLVTQVECRTERDDWPSFQQLFTLINEARAAYLRRHESVYVEKATEATILVWTSPDLVNSDRPRIALEVEAEINAVKRNGIVPPAEESFVERISTGLVHRDAPELAGLRLIDLLARYRT
ncbi:hypothetical protein AB0H83_31870 [Dactylosporangium sp. NPDC050688]|uniref:hypothetical protein n=1 Tax=Dactylosporangium sp. NPDC050688 TaxID=3157217 RepID=UPI0033E4E219